MWNTTFMMTLSCLHAVDLGSTLYLSLHCCSTFHVLNLHDHVTQILVSYLALWLWKIRIHAML
jgi:hypothetical protein